MSTSAPSPNEQYPLGCESRRASDLDYSELILYNDGIPYRLERVGGRMERRLASIFVTFPDSFDRDGGFELARRNLSDITHQLIIQALECKYCKKLDWRTFYEQAPAVAAHHWEPFKMTIWFTDESGELVSREYSVTSTGSTPTTNGLT